MKGYAAVSALLILSQRCATAADDLNGAARELARRTAAFAGRAETVTVAWRNMSALGPAELNQARATFETALREAGGRAGEAPSPAEARITLSQNTSQYLLVEEARKGDERQTWMAAWNRGEPAALATQGVALDKKLLWEQEEQILDVAFPTESMLVLGGSKLTWYKRQNNAWEPREALPVASPHPWPRDLRGRLRATGSSFQVFLPGMTCAGSVETALSMECRPADEPWVLDSGRFLVLANFAAARNHFDGRVVNQSGVRKGVTPFYSAAAVEDQGRPVWLLALVDGRTQILDAGMEPLGNFGGWGSDIAGTAARCGGGSQVLATRSGDGGEPDAIQAFTVQNGAPSPLTAPVDFPGPVTALWTSAGSAAVVVARDAAAGRYMAYVVTVVCPQ